MSGGAGSDPLEGDAATRRYYDAFSAGYDRGRDAGYHAMVDDLEAAAIAPHVPGADVLEIGCGTGLVAARLRRLGARRVVGVDLSPGMLRHAAERGVPSVLGRGTALPFADACFDVVCSFKVLAHVPRWELVLGEAARVVRPGGLVAVELYNRWSLRWLAWRLAGDRPTSADHREGDVYTRWDTPPAVRRGIERAGLVFEGFRGVRVVTPTAGVIRWPRVGPRVAALEARLVDSPLASFGGFLVALARRAPCPGYRGTL